MCDLLWIKITCEDTPNTLTLTIICFTSRNIHRLKMPIIVKDPFHSIFSNALPKLFTKIMEDKTGINEEG